MKKILILAALFTFTVTPVFAQFDYAGVKSCKKCHRKEYKSWKQTAMAEAFDILKSGQRAEMKKKAGLDPNKDYTTDSTCLPCHTTGYGQPGGFVSLAKTPTMAGVSCESCHGAGKSYNKVMKRRGRIYKLEEITSKGFIDDSTTTCSNCHNDKSPTRKFQGPFNAKESVEAAHEPVKLKYHTPSYQLSK